MLVYNIFKANDRKLFAHRSAELLFKTTSNCLIWRSLQIDANPWYEGLERQIKLWGYMYVYMYVYLCICVLCSVFCVYIYICVCVCMRHYACIQKKKKIKTK